MTTTHLRSPAKLLLSLLFNQCQKQCAWHFRLPCSLHNRYSQEISVFQTFSMPISPPGFAGLCHWSFITICYTFVICLYIWNPNKPRFDRRGLSFGALKHQNKGHSQVHIYIDRYTYYYTYG